MSEPHRNINYPKLLRPEGVTDEQWSLVKLTKSPEMAEAILATDDGVYPANVEAMNEFLTVSLDAERKAMNEYLKLHRTIGPKLAHAKALWTGHRARSGRLFEAMTDGLDGRNAD